MADTQDRKLEYFGFSLETFNRSWKEAVKKGPATQPGGEKVLEIYKSDHYRFYAANHSAFTAEELEVQKQETPDLVLLGRGSKQAEKGLYQLMDLSVEKAYYNTKFVLLQAPGIVGKEKLKAYDNLFLPLFSK
ncbi:MAG: hypothetical protein JWM96_740 [Alphaproteobacteria bacterium]|nr:hypothetical protein [Alphaproteobacteria bacterium]